jgi:hypothetical protein
LISINKVLCSGSKLVPERIFRSELEVNTTRHTEMADDLIPLGRAANKSYPAARFASVAGSD